ncbi:hypothetical protein [Natronorubrum sp. FCH18a]|uniref:hypothetical protein n=1 Tax=Natronorubrum sp. FCH18a TaxID=3447018 RepID=UPI003F5133BD
MKKYIHRMIIPFFMILFPAVWYINRNVMTEQLPPHTEPTTELVAVSIGVAVLGSTLFATIFVFLRRQSNADTVHELTYRQRVFQPDKTALEVFSCFIAVSFLWTIFEMGGVGPSWLAEPLYVLLAPIGIPLVVLAPLAIRFHWAVILGLIFCVLWMSLLANIASDIIHDRPLPMMNT